MKTGLKYSVCIGVLVFLGAQAALAQGNGTLSGRATDPDDSPLPGVSVSATSPVLLGTRQAVTDDSGNYRLLNLPPGLYAVEANLDGFAPVRREGIEMQAGATFRLDIKMSLGSVEDIITVTGESPMLEMATSGQVLTVDGDYQRTVPVRARQNWTDVLEMTPGVHARPFDDGSGRMVYFGHATEHFAHVIQLEGQIASSYTDSQPTYVQMPTDMIAGVEIKSSGVPAAEPLGTGLVMNVVTKSGGNEFSGHVGTVYQELGWNSDNSGGAGETASIQSTEQIDASMGGPLKRDKAWFFLALRDASNEAGISRNINRIALLDGYTQATYGRAFAPFNNVYEGTFPYAKFSAQIGAKHSFSAYYANDEVKVSGADEDDVGLFELRLSGGDLFGARVTSVLTDFLGSDILISRNTKTSEDHPDAFGFVGPQILVYERIRLRSSSISNSGFLIADQNVFDIDQRPSSSELLRADFTHYKPTSRGSHEFQYGIFWAPNNRRIDEAFYPNGGFYREYHVAIDENGNPRTSSSTSFNLADGTFPTQRRTRIPDNIRTIDQDDEDLGIYLQDNWKPNEKLSLSFGVRVDQIKRHDKIFNITRMDDTAVGPRFGFTYQLGTSGKALLRGSVGRVHEQVNGRDYATGLSSGVRVTEIREYDIDLDGVFEVSRTRPGVTPELARFAFAPGLQQPYTDEAVVGYRRQMGSNMALDVAFIRREHKKRYADVDINGIYPDAPHQPFGGFGLVDPERGIFNQLQNNTWSTLVYNAIEGTVVKRMSNNWQAMLGVSYQMHELDGTWNPTDRAGFIQPNAHKNTKCIWMPRGRRDDNSYQGGSNATYCPTWRPYTFRVSGVYNAPWDVVFSGSFFIQAGPWTGAIFEELDDYTDELAAIYGPEEVVSSTGNTEDNPLADLTRFKFATRDEGQIRLDDVMTLSFRAAKKIALTEGTEVEVAAQVLNPFNWGEHNQWTYDGANNLDDSNYLEPHSRQQPRAYQAFVAFRF